MSLKTKIQYCTSIVIFMICFTVRVQISAEITNDFVDFTRNLAVTAVEDRRYLKNDNVHGPLKLNISWLPPAGNKQPSSYSVFITTVLKDNDKETFVCPEESLYYTTGSGSQLNVLLPENRFLFDVPELSVRPACTYKIQVYANPRINFTLESPTLVYTVPECMGQQCSCADAKVTLSTPEVTAERQQSNRILIKWNMSSDNLNIRSYIISFGVPLLVSRKGLSVYNVSKIANVSSATTSFLWSLRTNENYTKLNEGSKISVSAQDVHGCLGPEGIVIIHPVQKDSILQNKVTWVIIAVITGVCAATFGILGLTWSCGHKTYNLVLSERSTKHIQAITTNSSHRSQLGDTILKKRNALYIEQEIEDAISRGETDKFEISYTRLKLIQELGKGQFGRVYLGSVEGYDETRVAVKMSRCSDLCSESDTRVQLLEEIAMMKAAGSHPHLVQLIGCCTLPNNPICVLLEYMEGGDLLAYLQRLRKNLSNTNIITSQTLSTRSSRPSITKTLYTTLDNEHLSTPAFHISSTNNSWETVFVDHIQSYVNVEQKNKKEERTENLCNSLESNEFLRFALEIAQGMAHLEVKGIIHRDLAARNILLNSDLTLKISDFGLSRNGVYVITNSSSSGVRRLPIRWMSPEALYKHAFSTKSDIWSFAVVLWEIGTLGAFPYSQVHDDQLLRHVLRDEGRLTRPASVSCELYKVMRDCWASHPEDRPTFAQLVHRLQTLSGCPYSLRGTDNPSYILLPPTHKEMQEMPPDSKYV